MENVDLMEVLENNLIYVDTSSFMHTRAAEFFYLKLMPALQKTNNTIQVPSIVVGELNNCLNKKDDIRKSLLAGQGLKLIETFKNKEIVHMIDSPSHSIADQFFLEEFVGKRFFSNLVLITQDVDLSKDIETITEGLKSVRCDNKVILLKINIHGCARKWDLDQTQKTCDYCDKKFWISKRLASKLEENNCSYIYCYRCNNVLSQTGEQIICEDCKEPFLFTDLHQRDYEVKGYDKPKRCKKCSEKRKNSFVLQHSFEMCHPEILVA